MAGTLLAMLSIVSVNIMETGMRSFNKSNSMSDATNDVSIALQYMTRDLQEAKDVTVVSSTQIRIFYPVKTNGVYDRSVIDNNTYIDYYRSDNSYNPKASGPWMVRKVNGQPGQRIAFNVVNINFKVPSPGSVDVSIGVDNKDGNTFNMIHRAIFMRNY